MVDWSKVRAGAVQVSDSLSTALERMIADGVVGHEERLPPERELAQQLGVSRTSLREALHELELKGLIDRRPGRGTLVLHPEQAEATESLLAHMPPDVRSLREVMDLRAVIEPPIAARAAQRSTARDRRRMREILTAMAEERSSEAIAELDVRFHEAIADATHNALLVRLLRFASEWIDESRRKGAFDRRRRERSIAAHGEILACIEKRDAEGAEDAMRRHIEAVNELVSGSQEP